MAHGGSRGVLGGPQPACPKRDWKERTESSRPNKHNVCLFKVGTEMGPSVLPAPAAHLAHTVASLYSSNPLE